MAALPELSLKILDYAREHGRVTVKDMVILTGASRNTLKEHFRKLVANGQLTTQGKGARDMVLASAHITLMAKLYYNYLIVLPFFKAKIINLQRPAVL